MLNKKVSLILVAIIVLSIFCTGYSKADLDALLNDNKSDSSSSLLDALGSASATKSKKELLDELLKSKDIKEETTVKETVAEETTVKETTVSLLDELKSKTETTKESTKSLLDGLKETSKKEETKIVEEETTETTKKVEETTKQETTTIKEETTTKETVKEETTTKEETTIKEETTAKEKATEKIVSKSNLTDLLSKGKEEIKLEKKSLLDEILSNTYESIEVRDSNHNERQIVPEEVTEVATKSTASNVSKVTSKKSFGKSITSESRKAVEETYKVIDILGTEAVLYKDQFPELFEYKYIPQETQTERPIVNAKNKATVSEVTTNKKEEAKSTVKKETKAEVKSIDKTLTCGSIKFIFRNSNGFTLTQTTSSALRYQSADAGTIVDCTSIAPASTMRQLSNAYKAAVRLYGEGRTTESTIKNSSVENIVMHTMTVTSTNKEINLSVIVQVDKNHALQINNTTGTEAGSSLIKSIATSLKVSE